MNININIKDQEKIMLNAHHTQTRSPVEAEAVVVSAVLFAAFGTPRVDVEAGFVAI